MSETKKPRWLDEDWKSITPDAEKIVCKDCFHREEDRKIGNHTIPGCTLAMCKAYALKPNGILFNGEDCVYHLSDSEDDGE